MSSRGTYPDDPHEHGSVDQASTDLPEGWSYQRIGDVVVRSKPMRHLSREAYIQREVESSRAIGDPRSPTEIEAAVEQELEYQAARYSSPTD